MQSIVLVKINQWAIYKKYRYKKKENVRFLALSFGGLKTSLSF